MTTCIYVIKTETRTEWIVVVGQTCGVKSRLRLLGVHDVRMIVNGERGGIGPRATRA